MPGIVVFRRRWSVGSDDLVIPGLTLFTIHFIWLVVLSVTLIVHSPQESGYTNSTIPPVDTTNNQSQSWGHFSENGSISLEPRTGEKCQTSLHFLLLGHVALLAGSVILEACMAGIALRGTIMNTEPRAPMQFILYTHLVILLVDFAWLILSILWLHDHYATCRTSSGAAKESLLGVVITELVVVFSVLVTVWCTFDAAGRSWVKMKRFQRSLRDDEAKFHYKRSGGHRPNWRQRKVLRAYQDSWNHRCRMLFCCMGRSDRYQDSFTDIARLLSDFFRDLDVVPSDVVAGLVLLRREQRLKQEALAHQHGDGIYEFLSGVPVTPRTRFVALTEPQELEVFRKTLHFMRYALAAYGWPMFVMQNTCSFCKLCPYFKWTCCCCQSGDRHQNKESLLVTGDNCGCNQAALHQVCQDGDYELLYASFHVDVAETPFFIAIDYDLRNIVVSIRGTISMKDVITDLNAEGEVLPLEPSNEDFIGHKGMVQAAIYIRDKLAQEDLIRKAQAHKPERGTDQFDLVLVGHSLGAGTAAILAIMLRNSHRNLTCYAYSPPGGLLSLAAMEYTKSFVTSVVVGKDVVPRLGLHQLETLRSDLMQVIKKCPHAKWQTIACGMMCCSTSQGQLEQHAEVSNLAILGNASSSEASLEQPKHPPMYPPGRIMHVVRQHPRRKQQKYDGKRWRYEPVYQAIWAENTDFNEVLISPVMIQDHMPDKVLRALQKVASHNGPTKPQRVQSLHLLENFATSGQVPDSERSRLLNSPSLGVRAPAQAPHPSVQFATSPHRLYLETSFTSIDHSPTTGGTNKFPSLVSSTSSSSNSGSRYKFTDSNSNNPRSTIPIYTRPPLVNLPANLGWDYLSILGDELRKTPSEANAHWYTQGLDNFPEEYSLLAPLATPETLSDVSSTCSRRSLALSPPQLRDLHATTAIRSQERRWRHKSLQNSGSNSPRFNHNSATLELPSRKRASRHYSLLSGDSAMSFFDASTATETSSAYCLTPVFKTSPPILESPARLQMTREIMDLYHDAAADVMYSSPSSSPITASKLANQLGQQRKTITSSSSSTSPSLEATSPVTATLVSNPSETFETAIPTAERSYRSPGPPPPLNTEL